MLIKMLKQEFDLLEDRMLPRACFEPIIPLIQAKDVTVKVEVYRQLTPGQQALFMFNAYYNHASHSLAEFYWWSAYYLAQPKAWSEIQVALRYFKDDNMLQLLEQVEGILKAKVHLTSFETFDVSYNDLDKDPELCASISILNTRFHEMASSTLQRVGAYIRNNPTEFIQLD